MNKKFKSSHSSANKYYKHSNGETYVYDNIQNLVVKLMMNNKTESAPQNIQTVFVSESTVN